LHPLLIIYPSTCIGIFPLWACDSTILSYPKPRQIYIEIHGGAHHFGDMYHDEGLVTLYVVLYVFVGFVPYHGIEALWRQPLSGNRTWVIACLNFIPHGVGGRLLLKN
jgi:hypothetical protein